MPGRIRSAFRREIGKSHRVFAPIAHAMDYRHPRPRENASRHVMQQTKNTGQIRFIPAKSLTQKTFRYQQPSNRPEKRRIGPRIETRDGPTQHPAALGGASLRALVPAE